MIRLVLGFVVFIALSFHSISIPFTAENQKWNINRNPTATQPKDYYGEWPQHTYFPSPPDWRKIGIYQLVTDRFVDGDPSNNELKYGGYNLFDVGSRHGGDFLGIADKIPYIKGLGYDAIWISPIFQNQENSYHGYAQIDFTLLDARWGTLEDFRTMVNTAHQYGIYVIIDIVVNHMANLLYFEDHEDSGAPFRLHDGEYRIFPRDPNNVYPDFQVDNTWDPHGYYGTVYQEDGNPTSPDLGGGTFSFSDFHHNGDLQNYGDVWQNHLGKIYGIMDDLRNDHPRVQEKLIAMTKSLIASADIDGIRMDTPMQVPLSFFQRWAPAVREYATSLGKDNFLIFGEFFCSKERAATMTGRGKTPDMFGVDKQIGDKFTFDGGIFYPLYNWFNLAIRDQNNGNLNGIKTIYNDALGRFDFMNPRYNDWRYSHLHFFNNHDQWRLSASPDGFAKTDLSAAIITFFPGIPLYYYGDEQGFLTYGTALDGWSREDMMTSLAWNKLPTIDGKNPCQNDNFDMTNPHYLWVQKLNAIRKAYPVLQTCQTIYERWQQTNNQNGIYAFSRICGDDPNMWVLVVWNTWKTTLFTTDVMYTGWPGHKKIVNLLNTAETYILGTNGEIQQFGVNGYETKVFVLDSGVKKLEPVVTSVSPAHDAALESTQSIKISITFSQNMDVGSIDDALQVDHMGVSSLSFNHNTNTLTFTVNGLEDGIHTITVNGNAKSIDGLKLAYPLFRSRFRVGSIDNVIINPAYNSDPDLIEVIHNQDNVVLRFHHKAEGAVSFRYKDNSNRWSDWNDYAEQTDFNAPPNWKGSYTVQYWVDGSAAYFVSTTLS